MFANIKHVAMVGAALAGLGWVTVVSPPAAHAQPPRIPPGNNFSCPDTAGTNYVLDPDNSNAYYLCENGSEQQHNVCPGVTKLVMSTPPKCTPWSPHHMP